MIGYDIAQALPLLRAEAESRMTETVTVGVYKYETNQTTGKAFRTLVSPASYSGKARIRFGSRGVVNANAPNMPVAIQEPYLSVPVGSALIPVGHEVDVSASSADAALIGRRFRIAGAPLSGQVAAHRYPLEEVN